MAITNTAWRRRNILVQPGVVRYPFRINVADPANLRVIFTPTGETQGTELQYVNGSPRNNNEFTVSLVEVGGDNGGDIILFTGHTLGGTMVVERHTPLTITGTVKNAAGYADPDAADDTFDRIVRMVQQVLGARAVAEGEAQAATSFLGLSDTPENYRDGAILFSSNDGTEWATLAGLTESGGRATLDIRFTTGFPTLTGEAGKIFEVGSGEQGMVLVDKPRGVTDEQAANIERAFASVAPDAHALIFNSIDAAQSRVEVPGISVQENGARRGDAFGVTALNFVGAAIAVDADTATITVTPGGEQGLDEGQVDARISAGVKPYARSGGPAIARADLVTSLSEEISDSVPYDSMVVSGRQIEVTSHGGLIKEQDLPGITLKKDGVVEGDVDGITQIDFRGDAVTIETTGDESVVTIAGTGGDSGGSSIAVTDEGNEVAPAGEFDTLNFVGRGVSATRTRNQVDVSIGGGTGGGLTQAQVDLRVRALVADEAEVGNTDRWPASKVPEPPTLASLGGLTQAEVDARVGDAANAATTAKRGNVELATSAEVEGRTERTKAMTPAGYKTTHDALDARLDDLEELDSALRTSTQESTTNITISAISTWVSLGTAVIPDAHPGANLRFRVRTSGGDTTEEDVLLSTFAAFPEAAVGGVASGGERIPRVGSPFYRITRGPGNTFLFAASALGTYTVEIWLDQIDTSRFTTGGTAADAAELDSIDALPAVADYEVGDIVNVQGVLWKLAAGTDDPHVYHGYLTDGTSAADTPDAGYIGDTTFSFDADPPGNIRLYVPTALATDANMYLEYVRPDPHHAAYDELYVVRTSDTTSRTGFTRYAQSPDDGFRIGYAFERNYLGKPFSVAAYRDEARTQQVRIVNNANRWVLVVNEASRLEKGRLPADTVYDGDLSLSATNGIAVSINGVSSGVAARDVDELDFVFDTSGGGGNGAGGPSALSTTAVYDGAGTTAVAVTASQSNAVAQAPVRTANRQTGLQLFTPLFDLDMGDRANGVYEVTATITLSARNPTTIGFTTDTASPELTAEVSGYVFASRVKNIALYNNRLDRDPPRAVAASQRVGNLLPVYNGSTKLGDVGLYLNHGPADGASAAIDNLGGVVAYLGNTSGGVFTASLTTIKIDLVHNDPAGAEPVFTTLAAMEAEYPNGTLANSVGFRALVVNSRGFGSNEEEGSIEFAVQRGPAGARTWRAIAGATGPVVDKTLPFATAGRWRVIRTTATTPQLLTAVPSGDSDTNRLVLRWDTRFPYALVNFGLDLGAQGEFQEDGAWFRIPLPRLTGTTASRQAANGLVLAAQATTIVVPARPGYQGVAAQPERVFHLGIDAENRILIASANATGRSTPGNARNFKLRYTA